VTTLNKCTYLLTYLLSIGTNLNDLEWLIALILHFFTEFDSFAGRLCDSGLR